MSGYKAALREFIAAKGTPVRPGDTRFGYDWFEAEAHIDATYGAECRWVVPAGARLTEDTAIEWGGTFGDSTSEMVVDVTGAHCECGQFTDVTLRWVGSFGDCLRAALGADNAAITL